MSIHPSFVHASRSRDKKAWQCEMEAMAVAVHGYWRFFFLQVIVRAGKVPPRRAWLLVGGPTVKFSSGQYSLVLSGRSLLSRTKVGALSRKDKPLAAIWAEVSFHV